MKMLGLNSENVVIVRWFKDFALERRLGHIIYCVEKNEWPVGKAYSAYTGCQGIDLDIPLYETVKRIPTTIDLNIASSSLNRANTPDVITITTDQGVSKQLNQTTIQSVNTNNAAQVNNQNITPTTSNKKRKRHIAIDVETERAKLHALLNNTQTTGMLFLIIYRKQKKKKLCNKIFFSN